MPPLLTGHRLQLYGVFSTILVSAVIASAFHKHSNFYSATVFLSRSSASVMVLANYGGFLTLLFGRVVQQIFFGRLSNQEVERLYDRTWFFLTESLLAFTIFRDEFDAPFVVMFAALLFLKCFHWLIADRIDWMDQQPYPGPPWLFHIRTNVMFAILWTIDVLMLDFAVESVLTHGVGGIVLFGSEYAILLATCLNSMMKYGVMVYDLRRARSRGGEDAPVWENKSMYMFYIELVTDFLKLTTYLAFFTIVMTFFGLPLNIIRDVYMTGVSFYTRFRDLLRYRAATKDMETKYPDATEAELTAMSDRTCIICREDMAPNSETPRVPAQPAETALGPNGLPQPGQALGLRDPPKKLPCGHVFHFQCLRSWLERQQSCPTCRRSVLEPAGGEAAAAQAQRGGGPAAPPAPGAVPQAPGQAAPTGAAATAQGRPTAGNGRVRPPTTAVPREFQGFSIGGKWQSWENPAAAAASTDNVATTSSVYSASAGAETSRAGGAISPAVEDALSTGTATPTPTTAPVATPAVAATAEPAAAPTVPATATATTPSATEGVPELSAREAAAAAALRRLNRMASSLSRPSTNSSTPASSSSSPPTVAGQTIPQVPATADPTPSLPATSSDPPPIPPSSSIPAPAIPEAPIASTSQPVASSSTPSTSKARTTLPALIPLFDPSTITHRPFVNIGIGSGFDLTPGLSTPGAGGPYYPHPSLGARTSSYNTFAPQANASNSFPLSSSQARTPAANTPQRVPSQSSLNLNPTPSSSQQQPLPPTRASSYALDTPTPGIAPLHVPNILMDETQLRNLDTWTREAIDERLRVLDDVQQSLWRAAAELQRVRSTIPPTPAQPQPPATTSTSQADVKGKGRAMFDDVVEEEAISGASASDSMSAVDSESPVAIEHLENPIL